MFIASYRNTEAGVKAIMAARLAEQRRIAAEKQREDEARKAEAARKAAEWAKAETFSTTAAFMVPFISPCFPRVDYSRRFVTFGRTIYRRQFDRIEATAVRLFDISRKELRSDRRNREVVFARQFIMYWAARLTKLSMPQIGRRIGGRDHTTVMSGRDAYRRKRAAMGRNLREAR